eukprot:6198752-Pleurochrysis_carterae.AAC.1
MHHSRSCERDNLAARNALLTRLMCDNQSIEEHMNSTSGNLRSALVAIQSSEGAAHRIVVCTVKDIISGFEETYMRNILLDQICSYDIQTQIVLAAYTCGEFASNVCTVKHVDMM